MLGPRNVSNRLASDSRFSTILNNCSALCISVPEGLFPATHSKFSLLFSYWSITFCPTFPDFQSLSISVIHRFSSSSHSFNSASVHHLQLFLGLVGCLLLLSSYYFRNCFGIICSVIRCSYDN